MHRTAARWALVALLLAAGATSADDRTGPKIRLKGAAFEVTGLPEAALRALAKAPRSDEEWAALFAVYVDGTGKRPPVVGSYSVAGGVLRFEPRYPPQPGVKYRAVLDPARLPGAAGWPAVVAEFLPPRPQAPPTVVTHVYPTRSILPENQLKFYIHFSAPMSQGEAYDHIRLLDAGGKVVEGPFLQLIEELWDPSGRRFTLLLHPGRIKRGLKPREELGPALEEGKSYTLVSDRSWPDAHGNPLKETYRKAFKVVAPDDTQPDPKTWKVQAPAAGTTDPVTVTFPEPLDHAMLQRVVWVADDKGQAVEGTVTISDQETRWRWTPKQPWQAGRYNIIAETTLEDLAGNSIERPFEVDVFRRVEKRIEAKTVTVPFVVKESARP